MPPAPAGGILVPNFKENILNISNQNTCLLMGVLFIQIFRKGR